MAYLGGVTFDRTGNYDVIFAIDAGLSVVALFSGLLISEQNGIEYVCRQEDLKRADRLSEEEKDTCMSPSGDA